jgi:hypothetical protein
MLGGAVSPEARFGRELEQFRHDSNAAAQFLYAWVSFHACANENQKIRRGVNESARFWNTTLGALQTSLFIVLGRIFDRDPKSHTLERLLREATQNPSIFSRRALAQRKAKQSPGATWIKDYVREAYVPSKTDFARLQRFAAAKRTIYERAYQKIRHKIFAHSGISSRTQSDALFAKTNVRELQRLVLALGQLHEALWKLYVNGTKPEIGRSTYTISALRKLAQKGDRHIPSIQEAIVKDTYDVLALYDRL